MKRKIIVTSLLFLFLALGLLAPNASPISADLADDFFEDFEGSVFPSWTATGLWHLEDNRSSSYPIYNIPSAPRYMWYGSNATGSYNTSTAPNSGELISDLVDVSNFTENVYLEFWSLASTENSDYYDLKQVQISTDGGTTWIWAMNVTDTDVWQPFSIDITSMKSSAFCVKFVFDTVDALSNDYPGWMIDNIRFTEDNGSIEGNFDLWIEQDYLAIVGQTKWMYLNIYSSYNVPKTVNLTFLIETPQYENLTLFEESFIYLEAMGRWTQDVEYTFNESGCYNVYFLLIDEFENIWSTSCYWEVSNKEFFDVWISQENYARVGDTREIYVSINSYFLHSMYIEVKVEIKTPSTGYILYENTSIYIETTGTWYVIIDYTFPEAGRYDVYVCVIDDIGKYWEAYCWWDIYEGDFFGLGLYQDHRGFIGEPVYLDAWIDSYFLRSVTASIELAVIHPDSTREVLYYNTSYFFTTEGDYWFFYTELTFYQIGHYIVELLVIDDTGNHWRFDCWWDILGYDQFYLQIEQQFLAKIHEEYWMKFHVESTFNVFKTVTVEGKIITPDDETIVLFYNDTLGMEPWSTWGIAVPYTFTKSGHYEVYFRVTDELDTIWTASCWWDVSEETPGQPWIEINGSKTVAINETFTVKGEIFSGDQNLEIFGVKLFVDGRLVANESVSLALNPMESYTTEFTIQVTEEGSFEVSIEADTNKGVLKANYVITVGNTSANSTSTSSSTEPTLNLTPGFEYSLIPLFLLSLIIWKKKRH